MSNSSEDSLFLIGQFYNVKRDRLVALQAKVNNPADKLAFIGAGFWRPL